MVDYNKVASRLTMLGFTPEQTDRSAIEFEIELILNYVVVYCNFTSQSDIPDILDNRIIDRICSEYLFKRKNSGQLSGFDYDGIIKVVKEGDTQIQYGTENDGDTPESRFDKFVDNLNRGFDKWLTHYRRLKW